jgi:hypothetical protein
MSIDWAALGQVFGISLAVTVGVVGVFTLGIMGTSHTPEAQPQGASGGASPVARTGAYACFALCAAVVAYGIYLIVA